MDETLKEEKLKLWEFPEDDENIDEIIKNAKAEVNQDPKEPQKNVKVAALLRAIADILEGNP